MPIEATFIGNSVQTSDTEIVEVHQRNDGDERVVLVDRVPRTATAEAPKQPYLKGKMQPAPDIPARNRRPHPRTNYSIKLNLSRNFSVIPEKLATLRGKTVAIAFFENSTRISAFATAAARLGAHVTMNPQAESSA